MSAYIQENEDLGLPKRPSILKIETHFLLQVCGFVTLLE
jgi:hypothetical protein